MNKQIYSYSLFAFPLSFVGIPLYIFLPEFYASNFGISLASIGIIVLLTRGLDTITDPICGYISDTFPNFRKHIICISAILLGFAFYLLFNPVLANKTGNLVVVSAVTYLCFSMLTVNHLALVGTFQDKVLASSTRELFTVAGLLFATLLPSLLMLKFSPIKTFQIVGIAVFVILVLCAFLFWKNFTLTKTIEKNQISWQWAKNGVLWKYFTVLLINGMAIATPSTLVIFYIKNFLQLEKFTGLFLMTYFLSAILFIPIWKRLCNKIGAEKLFKVGIIGSIVVFSACFFVQSGNVAFYLGICFFSGVFFGIDLIAPTLITNSIIESNKMETARTFIFGITHFISKISIAIISGVLLIILGAKTGASYQTILHFSYTILPCILKIVALFIFSFVKNV